MGTTRGVGMMAAIELVADKETRRSFDPSFGVKAYAVDRAREHGLIIRSALAGDSLAFAPPLVMTEAEMEEMMRRFTAALDDTTRWVAGGRATDEAGGVAADAPALVPDCRIVPRSERDTADAPDDVEVPVVSQYRETRADGRAPRSRHRSGGMGAPTRFNSRRISA